MKPITDDATPRLIELDPFLGPYRSAIEDRIRRFRDRRIRLTGDGLLAPFAAGHLYFGFHRTDAGWVYREWAPGADALSLIGDFNGWDRTAHPLNRRENGVWECVLAGSDTLRHGQRVKVYICSGAEEADRIPLYIRRVVQDPETHDFSGQIWMPDVPFRWSDATFRNRRGGTPRIYEAHIGMAQEREGIGTYREFKDRILPRIRDHGYTAVQLMAVMQHPYYASFGYHVSSYFAPSSWFGTPDELKELVDAAHKMGLSVLMDLVHSHAVKNTAEGINRFDGTDTQFFHAGARGYHDVWDSRLFDYGKDAVVHFLLSGIRYWMEEFHFDGFRFDGVTSMLYRDHGTGTAFDHYDRYFSGNTDADAVEYLQLANDLIHEIRPDALSVAEDVSGMPGLCRPIADGGIGFDSRLAMGMPDFWIRTLKQPDENWDLNTMWHELTTRRPGERRVGYVESHDQALVGDKTLIFRMADRDMYEHMVHGQATLVVERAVALHKMIRLATLTACPEGYLNFMGNEFGHPEWIDFPREGNGWSYLYSRRQWHLADDPSLYYHDLDRFDRALMTLAESGILGVMEHADDQSLLSIDPGAKILAFRTGQAVCLFNFHPTDSCADCFVPVPEAGRYQVILDTDHARFGGQDRIAREILYESSGPDPAIRVYLPCRTAMVLIRRMPG